MILYRVAPNGGIARKGSLWYPHDDNRPRLELLATVEADAGTDVPDLKLWKVDDPIERAKTLDAHELIEDLELARREPAEAVGRLRDFLRAQADRYYGEDGWLEVRNQSAVWAMLYVGDKPLVAEQLH